MKTAFKAFAALVMCVGNPGFAQDGDAPVKIGVLTDMSSVFADNSGRGSVEAARMAVEDFGGTVLGRPIEVLFADHQAKADIGAATARRWFDVEGVNVIADLTGSSVAVAVQSLARDLGKITLTSGSGTTALTNEECSPTGFHWTYDTYALAAGTGKAVVERGGDTWYMLGVDYTFGHNLASETQAVVERNGGEVVGSAFHPLNTTDFSSFLLQAQASGAKVIGLATGGKDVANAVKQASEFGISGSGQSFAALLLWINDVKAIGLELGQGMMLTEPFYWDQTDETREFSQRFFEEIGRMPTEGQAGTYSSVLHYLKAVEHAGTTEEQAVVASMRELPINDFMTDNGSIRVDGRVMRDFYLYEVKSPDQSTGPWDLYNVVTTIPREDVALPLSESKCPLVNN
ncbi:ABC transporter permease [Roseovarius sp. HI0049]|nr:ABC transporter permease [Roseovarius sp. HI0049]